MIGDRQRGRGDQDCRTEDFFQENPALATAPDRALDLIWTEYDTREALGQSPVREDFLTGAPPSYMAQR